MCHPCGFDQTDEITSTEYVFWFYHGTQIIHNHAPTNPDKPVTAMIPTTPHYLLISQVDRTEGTGQWRFLLRADDGALLFEVADREPGLQGERYSTC